MRPVFASAVLAVLTAASGAGAYSLHETAQGAPVRWDDAVVEVAVDPSMDALGEGALEAVRGAFAAWSAPHGAYPPEVRVVRAEADPLGYREAVDDRNTVRYLPGGFGPAGSALAVTVLTYESSGKVVDADIVINGGSAHPIAVPTASSGPGSTLSYDLQNVLAHEAGHFLGLGEEHDEREATMYFAAALGETKKRELHLDDVLGLRALYAEPLTESFGGCALAPGRAGAQRAALGALLALGAALLASRRRRAAVLAAALGSAVALTAALASLAAPTVACSVAEGALDPAVFAQVLAAEPRWERGLVVTRLVLALPSSTPAPSAGGAPSCGAATLTVDVLGGGLDGMHQVVGHSPVPATGARFPVGCSGGELVLPERFPLRLRPAAPLP